MKIKIGDTFYMFDTNRRIYKRDENGRALGGPSFRGHFYEVTIDGETSRSWLIDSRFRQIKVPKKDPFSVLYTEQMIDDAEWVSEHRYRIESFIRSVKDADVLRRVADLIGYVPDKDGQ